MAERPLFLGRSQPAARINRPPTAGNFHTCGLRGVFCHAHVATKNDFNLFRAVRGAKVCDAFGVICEIYSFFALGTGESSLSRVKPKIRAPPMTCIAVMLSPSRVTETRTATRGSM